MPYADPYGSAPPPRHTPYEAPGKETDTIVVPSEAVGMIIGKGGETIKDMQNMTGCKINVAPPSGPNINREIGLIGPRSAIEQGKRAILDKREKQGGVWTRGQDVGGAPQQQQPSYSSDPYAAHQPSPYGQPPSMPPHASSVPPPAVADPYAIYGGYDAYCVLWAAATAGQGPPQGH